MVLINLKLYDNLLIKDLSLFMSTPALSQKYWLSGIPYSLKTDFDVIAVSESRLIKDKLPTIKIGLPKFAYFQETHTVASWQVY